MSYLYQTYKLREENERLLEENTRLRAIIPLARRVVDYRDDGTPHDILELDRALKALPEKDNA